MKERRIGIGGGRAGRRMLSVALAALVLLALRAIHVTYTSEGTTQPIPIQSIYGEGKNERTNMWEEKDKNEVQEDGARVIKEEDVVGMEEEDPKLVRFVKQRMQPPSVLPHNLTNPNKTHYSQYEQSKILDEKFLHGMLGGLFVEAGALDGERFSNTLYLEKHLGWSGVLVEPMPTSFELLRHKNRRAYILNAALSTTKFASQVVMTWEGLNGGGSFMAKKQGNRKRKMKANQGKKDTKVTAVPFHTIFLALNITQIDFLSLDLEGVELQVLKTLPWEKLKIRIMCVECNKVKHSALTTYLTSVGYRHLGNYGIDCWYGWPPLLDEMLLNTVSKKSK